MYFTIAHVRSLLYITRKSVNYLLFAILYWSVTMGSRGTMPYEFKKCNVEKSVATEVVAVESEVLEKAVAEEVKVPDPVNAQEVIEQAVIVEPAPEPAPVVVDEDEDKE